MEEKQNPDIQEDETLKNPQQENESQATEKETDLPQEDTTVETPSKRRHKGRHSQMKALEEEKAKYAELNDSYLRLYSEFENYRKRTAKEKLDMTATASASVIKDILPVFDDFERAILNMEKNSDDNDADIQGVKLIYNKLKSVLQKKGLEEIVAMDTDFSEE